MWLTLAPKGLGAFEPSGGCTSWCNSYEVATVQFPAGERLL
jgi:hypothetical protein